MVIKFTNSDTTHHKTVDVCCFETLFVLFLQRVEQPRVLLEHDCEGVDVCPTALPAPADGVRDAGVRGAGRPLPARHRAEDNHTTSR